MGFHENYENLLKITYFPSSDMIFTLRASNYGQVPLKRIGTSLVSTLIQIQEACSQSTDPLTFESIDHPYGFVLYTATLSAGGKTLVTPNIKDYGYVFVNNNYQVREFLVREKRVHQLFFYH